LAALERLDLALLVDAQHQGMVGRIEIQPDDIPQLFDEPWMRNPAESGQRFRSKLGSESDLSWAPIPTKVGTGPG
jgi:hypothetical protein